MTTPIETYENLASAFGEEEGVSVASEGLLVHGTLFAFFEGGQLVVELPAARSHDLVVRGVAKAFRAEGETSREWVRVSDEQLWPELTRESHEYVGEPHVGGQS